MKVKEILKIGEVFKDEEKHTIMREIKLGKSIGERKRG